MSTCLLDYSSHLRLLPLPDLEVALHSLSSKATTAKLGNSTKTTNLRTKSGGPHSQWGDVWKSHNTFLSNISVLWLILQFPALVFDKIDQYKALLLNIQKLFLFYMLIEHLEG